MFLWCLPLFASVRFTYLHMIHMLRMLTLLSDAQVAAISEQAIRKLPILTAQARTAWMPWTATKPNDLLADLAARCC